MTSIPSIRNHKISDKNVTGSEQPFSLQMEVIINQDLDGSMEQSGSSSQPSGGTPDTDIILRRPKTTSIPRIQNSKILTKIDP